MDFSLSSEQENLRHAIRDFVQSEIFPLELESSNYDDHENIRMDRLAELREKVKAAGL